MMPEPKLKPCPFCGGEAKTRVTILRGNLGNSSDYAKFKVYCSTCHIEQNCVIDCDSNFKDVEDALLVAICKWNTRDSN